MSSAHSGPSQEPTTVLEPKLSRDEKGPPSLSTNLLTRHNQDDKPVPPLEWIVVRIEVSDTGCGIKPRDMAHNKLFCEYMMHTVFLRPKCVIAAFNQTEQGRTQGRINTLTCSVLMIYASLQGERELV